MPDYSKGKIYKIQCDTTGLVYIGSTTQAISQRMSNHISTFKGGYSLCSSQCVLQKNNYRYSLIEEYPCESREQLNMREQYHIENNDCVNKCRAFSSEDEKKQQIMQWREDNRDALLKGKREYYNKNKQKWIDNSREWVLNNRERVRENQSKWVENNRERVRAYKREWAAKKRSQLLDDSSSGSVN